jgi:methylase of polypeptide subunit release factors
VIHEPIDFFANTHLGDLIVSNPPFTKKKEVLETLLRINKPFILLRDASCHVGNRLLRATLSLRWTPPSDA